jgi:hypothetical protein
MDLVSSSAKIKPSPKAPTKSAAWLAMYTTNTPSLFFYSR